MLEFDWNPEKADRNYEKHGVSFVEAATVFDDPFALTRYDSLHSQEEERFVTIGYSDRYRLLVVIHTERNYHTRIISSLPVTNQEKIQTNSNALEEAEMLDEYDFSIGERGKYYQAYQNNNLSSLSGVQFLRDYHQRRTGVLLDLQKHQKLWEEVIKDNAVLDQLQFLMDHQGHYLAVILNFKDHLPLWQTIYDRLIIIGQNK